MRTEKEIKALEDEIEALKASFEQSAATLKTVAESVTVTTVPTKYSLSNSSTWDPEKWQELWNNLVIGGVPFRGPFYADEILQVTFRSNSGSNTLAELEIEELSQKHNGIVRTLRVNYSGGARWILDCFPNVELYSYLGEVTWYPTILKLTIRSIMPGSLEVVQL